MRIPHPLPPIVHHAFRVLEHLLPPQIEEVVGVRVELESVLAVVPILVELVERRRLVTRQVRLEHGRGHCVA